MKRPRSCGGAPDEEAPEAQCRAVSFSETLGVGVAASAAPRSLSKLIRNSTAAAAMVMAPRGGGQQPGEAPDAPPPTRPLPEPTARFDKGAVPRRSALKSSSGGGAPPAPWPPGDARAGGSGGGAAAGASPATQTLRRPFTFMFGAGAPASDGDHAAAFAAAAGRPFSAPPPPPPRPGGADAGPLPPRPSFTSDAGLERVGSYQLLIPPDYCGEGDDAEEEEGYGTPASFTGVGTLRMRFGAGDHAAASPRGRRPPGGGGGGMEEQAHSGGPAAGAAADAAEGAPLLLSGGGGSSVFGSCDSGAPSDAGGGGPDGACGQAPGAEPSLPPLAEQLTPRALALGLAVGLAFAILLQRVTLVAGAAAGAPFQVAIAAACGALLRGLTFLAKRDLPCACQRALRPQEVAAASAAALACAGAALAGGFGPVLQALAPGAPPGAAGGAGGLSYGGHVAWLLLVGVAGALLVVPFRRLLVVRDQGLAFPSGGAGRRAGPARGGPAGAARGAGEQPWRTPTARLRLVLQRAAHARSSPPSHHASHSVPLPRPPFRHRHRRAHQRAPRAGRQL
jgi:hypothetical protein